jgi:magnesium-transporting ATPase (P-type)
MTSTASPRGNSSTPVLRRALVRGVMFTLALGVLAAVGFGIAFGAVGVTSAIVGAVLAAGFLGLTAASVLIAQRFDMVVFFAIVMGAWILKFALFLLAVVLLRDQPWINTMALFVTLIAGVIVSLITDVTVVAKSRMPFASDVRLPGE